MKTVLIIGLAGLIKEISGGDLNYSVSPDTRSGDHIWHISDVRKFHNHYPWKFEYDIRTILSEMIDLVKLKKH